MPRSSGLRGPGYSGAIIRRGQAYKTPAQCVVHAIDLERDGAVVRYRCGGGSAPQDEQGRTGMFPTHQPSTSATYPSLFLKGVRNVQFRGATFNGEGGVGFVLSPAAAKCEKRMGDTHVSCRLVGETSLPSLAGARRSTGLAGVRKERFHYFTELNDRGGIRNRFGPFSSKRRAEAVRRRTANLYPEKLLDRVSSTTERYPSNVPAWMKPREK